jgi:hypothetical protein
MEEGERGQEKDDYKNGIRRELEAREEEERR